MKKNKKLKWQRVADSFDLRVVNPEVLNRNVLKTLLSCVEHTKSWGRNFSRPAKNEFLRWLDNCDTPLREQAYARLSNWFLCDMEFIRKTDLAKAALQFWDALFCSRPKHRLTSPEKDHKIRPEKFILWWPEQLRCQKDY